MSIFNEIYMKDEREEAAILQAQATALEEGEIQDEEAYDKEQRELMLRETAIASLRRRHHCIRVGHSSNPIVTGSR